MSGVGIEDIAHSWLVDAAWTRPFKHTADVLQDYISYILIALGTICLSVRILTTMSQGDLMCILVGVENGTRGDLLPYAQGGGLGMIAYAQTDERCINRLFSWYMLYLPYIMIFESLLLVVIEKFTFKIPRIAQKVERFHKSIVEESLSGRDPETAEDLTDPKSSTDAILRRRQRNEICMSLKRSSMIHHAYIAKNVLETILVIFFLPLNISQILIAHENDAPCEIDIHEFPDLAINKDGIVHFQCRGKKMNFYLFALHAHNLMLICYGLCSVTAIVWCLFLRSVSSLLKGISRAKLELEQEFSTKEGHDFLFLFDLVAHSFGLESTLRVLTHSDEKFYEICTPRIVDQHQMIIEEDKIKIAWYPAPIEEWLLCGNKMTRRQKGIVIDSYEVTIFPAESVKNTMTLPARLSHSVSEDQTVYSAWFFDLQGGRREYVITVACQIGKSRMKGAKFVTVLVPYGPERPRTGMTRRAETDEVEIFWDPPKGDFTKYTLQIEQLANKPNFGSQPGPIGKNLNESYDSDAISGDFIVLDPVLNMESMRKMENLSSKLEKYSILGLEPATAYAIELGTKTGNTETRQKIHDIILTRPLPVQNLRVTDVAPKSATVHWMPVADHPCLKCFQLELLTTDGTLIHSLSINHTAMARLKHAKSKYTLTRLQPGMDYDLTMKAVAIQGDAQTISDEETTSFTTTVDLPKDSLILENSLPNSLTVSWDHPPSSHLSLKYKLKIEAKAHKQIQTVEMPSETKRYVFSKLEPGQIYKVSVFAQVLSLRNNDAISNILGKMCMTKPLPPSQLKLDPAEPMSITWSASDTATVQEYKVKWRKNEEGSDQDEMVVQECRFKFPKEALEEGQVYKVNVYAVAIDDSIDVEEKNESKELHEKLIMNDGTLNLYSAEI